MSTTITTIEEPINIVVNDEKISINVASGDVIVNVTENIVEVSTVNGGYPLPTTVYSVFGRTGTIVATEGDYNLDKLGDVLLNSSIIGDVLYYDGTKWINKSIGGTGTVTSVGATVPTGMTISGSPIVSAGVLAFGLSAGYSIPLTTQLMPTGGTTGQILTKNSATNYDTIWSDNYADWTEQLRDTVKAAVAINKGQAVYISDANGTNQIVSLASNTTEPLSSKTLGLAMQNLAINGIGQIITEGLLGGLNTSTATAGDPVWLGVSGNLIFGLANKPVAPAHLVYIGVVTRSNINNGEIYVKIQNGFELQELHNVLISSVANNQGLFYESATSLWKNKSIATVLGYTPISLTSLSATAPLSYNNTTGEFSISQSGSLTNGYLSSTDWNTFNGKQAASSNLNSLSALTYVSTAFVKMTASGTFALDTTAYGTGSVTNVSALTLGTSGTDLSSSVATGTTTPVITLNVPTASATNRGALSSADWSIFNGKQAAGNYITALSGEATASGPGSAAVTLSTSAVTGKLLTGVNITGGSITATDSILVAFGKVQNQINGVLGGAIYQSTWNASTNSPALTSSVGTKGYYYIVSVAGATNLDGITDWQVGDWAIFNGTTWNKVDNSDAVSSVNGFTGAVSLTTANISEVTNLYYTEGRVSANTDVAANTAARHAAVTLGTANGLSLSTQALSLGLASTSATGALSSTDWNTFNGKQSALTLSAIGSTPNANGLTLTGSALNLQPASASFGGVLTTGVQTIAGSKTFVGDTTNDGGQLGAELLSSAGWTSTGWTGTYPSFTHTTGNVTALTNTLAAVIGNNYQVSYTITGRTAGTISVTFGGALSSGAQSATGTIYAKATSTATLSITPTTDFNGTVVISVKQVTAGTADLIVANSSSVANIELRASGVSVTNAYIGLNSGRFNIGTSTNNTAFGSQSLAAILSSSNNTAIGYNTLLLLTTGSGNTAIGSNAGAAIVTASNNTLLGNNAGIVITGSTNTFIGSGAGQSLTSGTNNIGLGFQAGRYISTATTANTTSLNSIYIGYDVRASANGNTNEIIIAGYNGTAGSVGLGSNTTSIGNAATTSTWLGGNLTVNGTTISNASFIFTLPGSTGTLALTSQLTGGTVTSVAALTLGTTGTDLSSSVATGTTTPVITLNVPTASATNRGALSSTDWSTFNGKQAALSGTGFVKISGTTISYDNSTYLTTSSAASTYLPLTGGILTGNLNISIDTSGDINYLALNDSSWVVGDRKSISWYQGATKLTGIDAYYESGGNVGLRFSTYSSAYIQDVFKIASTGAAIFSSSVQADGGSSGFLINQNGGAAGLATYSANTDRAQIAFKYAQNYPASNNYTRVLDIVSTGDGTGGGMIRLFTTVNGSTPSAALTLGSTGAATFSSNVSVGETFGVGTAAPQSKFEVQNGNAGFYNPTASSGGAQLYLGDMNFAGGVYATSAPGIGAVYSSANGVAGDLAFFVYTGTASSRTERMRIYSSGAITCTGSVTATSFFESSDNRLKTLIQDNYQTKGIASITPKLYTKNGKVELGYYAQDFVGILDSAVSKGSDDMLSLSYREVLVAKVYALEQRIKELETK